MKKSKAPGPVVILVLTLITVIFWIFISVYKTLVTSEPPRVSERILEPLTPTLDTEAINKMEQRIQLREDEITTTFIQSSELEVEEAPTFTEEEVEEEAPLIPEATDFDNLEQ